MKKTVQRARRGGGRAFTLVELLVVIGLIVLLAAVALPSIVKIFGSGADAQAYNQLSAQLVAARALAVQGATYAGVHVQMADGLARPNLANTCWAAVVIYDPSTSTPSFHVPDGYEPKRVPGNIAFGEVSAQFVNGGSYNSGRMDATEEIEDFTTFTIVFSPSGSLVTRINGDPVSLDTARRPFTAGSLWDSADVDGKDGVTAVTQFDYSQFIIRPANNRAAYLDEYGQFLAINVHTGQMFPRE